MASADYSVLTPERVSLQYDIAGIGSRGAAVLIDTTIQVVLLVVVAMALSASALLSSALHIGVDPTGGVIFVVAVYVLALFLVSAGYFILFEVLWNGQTPGKRTLGVRVIRENGYPIRPVDSVIRNLVRIVDWLPASYAIGVVTMLLNRRSKRLGDFAAGTIVVREGRRDIRPEFVAAPHVEPSLAAHGYQLSRTDASLVRDFLTRRAALDGTARAALAERLSAALASRYGLPRGADAEAFLEQLDT